MNRTGIDWADYSWNPIVGCSHGCSYCYAKRNAGRFRAKYAYLLSGYHATAAREMKCPLYDWRFDNPIFIPGRLDEPARLRKPSMIFVCSMGEVFDPFIPDEWRTRIFDAMRAAPRHVYIILTKQPDKMRCTFRPSAIPPHFVAGITLDEDSEELRSAASRCLSQFADIGAIPMLSIEPLRQPMNGLIHVLNRVGRRTFLRWLIIGAQTGSRAVKPDPAWIVELVDAADAAGIPCWTKDNLRGICPSSHWRRQRPISPSSSASYRTPRSSASSSSEGGSHSSSKEFLP